MTTLTVPTLQHALPTFPRKPKFRHPAKFSAALMPIIAAHIQPGTLCLDPFGGTGGRLAQAALQNRARVIINEIQWKVLFTAASTRRTNANALYLPYSSNSLDAIITSPTYGNRMADKYTDGSRRNTYRAAFGDDEELHFHNTGAMQWGNLYRSVHAQAWQEAARVLKSGGTFLLNISDHIRAGKLIPVSRWHCETLQANDLVLLETHTVTTPRNRQGENGDKRAACEYIFVFQKP